jgi:hypothetical protein
MEEQDVFRRVNCSKKARGAAALSELYPRCPRPPIGADLSPLGVSAKTVEASRGSRPLWNYPANAGWQL